jgi:hypothetical protein
MRPRRLRSPGLAWHAERTVHDTQRINGCTKLAKLWACSAEGQATGSGGSTCGPPSDCFRLGFMMASTETCYPGDCGRTRTKLRTPSQPLKARFLWGGKFGTRVTVTNYRPHVGGHLPTAHNAVRISFPQNSESRFPEPILPQSINFIYDIWHLNYFWLCQSCFESF